MSAEFITLDPIIRGDHEVYDLALELEGEPQNLTGKTVRFTAKLSIKDPEPYFQKTVGDGIAIVDEENGLATLEIEKADTSGLTKAVTLVCDVEVQDVSGRPSTTLYKLPVKQDVTTN
jgi:hypothetical protein